MNSEQCSDSQEFCLYRYLAAGGTTDGLTFELSVCVHCFPQYCEKEPAKSHLRKGCVD